MAGVPGAPGFPHAEARAVSAACGGIRVVSVYVPNGRTPDSEHYRYKLAWLAALRRCSVTRLARPTPPRKAGRVRGHQYRAGRHRRVRPQGLRRPDARHAPGARGARRAAVGLGLRDVVRERWPTERVFTYWDYRAGMFHRDLGMRIDLVLATPTVAGRVRAAWVDRQARKGKGASDHAPVIVDLDKAPDGDIGPVVPPPSAPVAAKRGAGGARRLVVERAPQVAAGQRAVRAPRCGDPLHRGGVGYLVQRVGALDRVADAEVADRQHVGRCQVEHQEHVRAPHADALDGDELGDHLLVGQLVQALELQLAGERVLGEGAQVADLRA